MILTLVECGTAVQRCVFRQEAIILRSIYILDAIKVLLFSSLPVLRNVYPLVDPRALGYSRRLVGRSICGNKGRLEPLLFVPR